MMGLFLLLSGWGGAQISLEAGGIKLLFLQRRDLFSLFIYDFFSPDPTQLSSLLQFFGVTPTTGACSGEFASRACSSGAAGPGGL